MCVQDLDRAHGVPHVGVPGDRAQRLLLAAAADHDRQVRPGPVAAPWRRSSKRTDRRAADVTVSPSRAPGRPRRPRRASRAAGRSPAEVDAVRVVLQLEPRAAETEDGAPAADVVERRRRLRHEPRVAERVRADEQAEPEAFGGHRPAGERRPALEDRLVRVAEDRVAGGPRPTGGRSPADRSAWPHRPSRASSLPGSRAGFRSAIRWAWSAFGLSCRRLCGMPGQMSATCNAGPVSAGRGRQSGSPILSSSPVSRSVLSPERMVAHPPSM